MQKELVKTKRFFFIFKTFSSFFNSFMAPFWVVYFRSIGLSFEQISFLIIAGHLATSLFEIPTGAVADVYGRKFSISISLIIGTSVPLIFYLSNNFFTTNFSFFRRNWCHLFFRCI